MVISGGAWGNTGGTKSNIGKISFFGPRRSSLSKKEKVEYKIRSYNQL
jgi:hypothetical protein